MTSPTLEQVALLLSVVLVLWAPLSVALAHRIYTEEQRARAGGLYHAYLFGVTWASIAGAASAAWILAAGLPTIWLVNLLTAIPLPVILLQWKLHRKMGYTGRLGPSGPRTTK